MDFQQPAYVYDESELEASIVQSEKPTEKIIGRLDDNVVLVDFSPQDVEPDRLFNAKTVSTEREIESKTILDEEESDFCSELYYYESVGKKPPLYAEG